MHRSAMQFGVKHYLLKPCNEKQIISCLKEVIHNYYELYVTSTSFQSISPLNAQFQNNLIINLINSGLASFYSGTETFEKELKDKSRYLADLPSSYDVCYLYFLEEENREQAKTVYECLSDSSFSPAHCIHTVRKKYMYFSAQLRRD